MIDRLILKAKPISDLKFQTFKTSIEANLISPIRKRDWIKEETLLDLAVGDYLLDVEFFLLENAQKLWDFVNNNLNKIKLQVSGKLSWHKCSNDDLEIFNCKDDLKSEYKELII